MAESNTPKKVLIIEDERSISDIIKFNLVKEGYAVETAYDGIEGLDKALSCGCDLILLDIMLPLMDGFEVCKKVREKSRFGERARKSRANMTCQGFFSRRRARR